jgi:hypothetical protein
MRPAPRPPRRLRTRDLRAGRRGLGVGRRRSGQRLRRARDPPRRALAALRRVSHRAPTRRRPLTMTVADLAREAAKRYCATLPLPEWPTPWPMPSACRPPRAPTPQWTSSAQLCVAPSRTRPCGTSQSRRSRRWHASTTRRRACPWRARRVLRRDMPGARGVVVAWRRDWARRRRAHPDDPSAVTEGTFRSGITDRSSFGRRARGRNYPGPRRRAPTVGQPR